jgi:hypothetical protein
MQPAVAPTASNWIAVRMDVSSNCDQDFLDKVGGRVYDVYLLNTNETTYCCSATPSHACYFVESTIDRYIEDEDEREEVYNLLLESNVGAPLVSYYTRSDIGALPEDDVVRLGTFEDENEAFEYYQGNPSF